ncbi:hypothetical protein, partial [Diaphorobacter sp. J5-51]|uniref:hypothetical protein n=1 Tax=Diaphorobacter sp. J5-51 TaxID=680496 RepID=UPI001F31AE0A
LNSVHYAAEQQTCFPEKTLDAFALENTPLAGCEFIQQSSCTVPMLCRHMALKIEDVRCFHA